MNFPSNSFEHETTWKAPRKVKRHDGLEIVAIVEIAESEEVLLHGWRFVREISWRPSHTMNSETYNQIEREILNA